MKKFAIISALVAATFSGAVLAKPQGGFQDPNVPQQQINHKEHKEKNDHRSGGFVNSEQAVSKVTDVEGMKDNQYLVLQGNIVKQVGKEDYVFRDASGEITVEIDRKAWKGQEITPNNEVKLYGEVDKSWNKTEVEIHRVEKIQ